MSPLYIVGLILLWVPFVVFYPTTVLGNKRKPKGRQIITCNHLGITDIFTMAAYHKGQVHFLSKKEFYNKSWFTKMLVKMLRLIPVDRGKADLEAFRTTLKYLSQEKTIGLFPEGTRNKTGEDLLPIKGGSVLFALKGKAPIVPTMLLSKPKLFRRSYLIVGDPIYFEEFQNIKPTSDVLDKAAFILETEMRKLLRMVRLYRSLHGVDRRILKKKLNNKYLDFNIIYNEYFGRSNSL